MCACILVPHTQVDALEAIARSRSVGSLQSTLASEQGISNSNFFYVIKVRRPLSF